MSALKTAALVAAVVGGVIASADAQAYDHWGRGYGYGYGYHQPRRHYAPPVYVHPRIARKQAQLQERFVEKYGYVRPYGYGYRGHQPRHDWGYGYGRPHVHHFGW